MDPRYVESGATRYVSPVAGELSKTLQADGAGKIFYARFCNTTAAKIYIFLFNGNDSTDPILIPPIPVAANENADFMPYPIAFSAGLTIAASTSQTGYVAAGANAMQIEVLYKT